MMSLLPFAAHVRRGARAGISARSRRDLAEMTSGGGTPAVLEVAGVVHWVLTAGRWALMAHSQRVTAARDGSPRAMAGGRMVRLLRHVESRHVAPRATTATEQALEGQRRERRRVRRRVRWRKAQRKARRKARRAPGWSCHVARAALCTRDTCTCRAVPIPSANLRRAPSRAPADGRGRRPRGTISSTRRIGGARRRRTRGIARGMRRRRRLCRVGPASFDSHKRQTETCAQRALDTCWAAGRLHRRRCRRSAVRASSGAHRSASRHPVAPAGQGGRRCLPDEEGGRYLPN